MNTIKFARKKAKLTQQKLADKLGITREYLCAIENGHKSPSLLLINKISSEVGVSSKVLADDYLK